MKHKEFQAVLKNAMERSEKVLASKNAEYASGEDKLHNFKRAAAMQGCTQEKALMGMLAKHLVSILDIVDGIEAGKTYTQEFFTEKLCDADNYLHLLEAMLIERFGDIPASKPRK